MNAAGVAVSANASTNCQFVRPRLQYRHAPKPATSRLSASAVGFIVSGATENSAIAAMYAEAPPCPTLEYNAAPSANRRHSATTVVVSTKRSWLFRAAVGRT